MILSLPVSTTFFSGSFIVPYMDGGFTSYIAVPGCIFLMNLSFIMSSISGLIDIIVYNII